MTGNRRPLPSDDDDLSSDEARASVHSAALRVARLLPPGPHGARLYPVIVAVARQRSLPLGPVDQIDGGFAALTEEEKDYVLGIGLEIACRLPHRPQLDAMILERGVWLVSQWAADHRAAARPEEQLRPRVVAARGNGGKD